MSDSDSDDSDRERMLQDLDSPYAKRRCFHHHREDDVYQWSTEEWSFEEWSIDDGETDKAGLEAIVSIHIEVIDLKINDNLKDQVQKPDAEDQSEEQK